MARFTSSKESPKEINKIKESSSKKETSHSHCSFHWRTSAKKQFKKPANALAKSWAPASGSTMSGMGQLSLSHWTIAKAAIVSGSSLLIDASLRAGGVGSKTNADGKGRDALFLQRLQISSSISSKQWRHLPTGSGMEHISQHSLQKRRVSHGSLQAAHKGGKMKSTHSCKIF
jgi:hypothetical protein